MRANTVTSGDPKQDVCEVTSNRLRQLVVDWVIEQPSPLTTATATVSADPITLCPADPAVHGTLGFHERRDAPSIGGRMKLLAPAFKAGSRCPTAPLTIAEKPPDPAKQDGKPVMRFLDTDLEARKLAKTLSGWLGDPLKPATRP